MFNNSSVKPAKCSSFAALFNRFNSTPKKSQNKHDNNKNAVEKLKNIKNDESSTKDKKNEKSTDVVNRNNEALNRYSSGATKGNEHSNEINNFTDGKPDSVTSDGNNPSLNDALISNINANNQHYLIINAKTNPNEQFLQTNILTGKSSQTPEEEEKQKTEKEERVKAEKKEDEEDEVLETMLVDYDEVHDDMMFYDMLASQCFNDVQLNKKSAIFIF